MTVRTPGRHPDALTLTPDEIEVTRRLVDLEALPLSVAVLLWLFANPEDDTTVTGRASRLDGRW